MALEDMDFVNKGMAVPLVEEVKKGTEEVFVVGRVVKVLFQRRGVAFVFLRQAAVVGVKLLALRKAGVRFLDVAMARRVVVEVIRRGVGRYEMI